MGIMLFRNWARRWWQIGACSLMIGLFATHGSAAAFLGGDGAQHKYRILVRGIQIGEMSVTYQPGPEQTHLVTTDTNYQAPSQNGTAQQVRFVTRESWDQNGFVALKGRVASGATDARFSARRLPDGQVEIVGTRQKHTVSPGALPLQFWNADTMKAPLIYEPITGAQVQAQRQRIRDDIVTVANRQITCTMYRLNSNTGTIELWYDQQDMLCFARVSGTGTSFVYVREDTP